MDFLTCLLRTLVSESFLAWDKCYVQYSRNLRVMQSKLKFCVTWRLRSNICRLYQLWGFSKFESPAAGISRLVEIAWLWSFWWGKFSISEISRICYKNKSWEVPNKKYKFPPHWACVGIMARLTPSPSSIFSPSPIKCHQYPAICVITFLLWAFTVPSLQIRSHLLALTSFPKPQPPCIRWWFFTRASFWVLNSCYHFQTARDLPDWPGQTSG